MRNAFLILLLALAACVPQTSLPAQESVDIAVADGGTIVLSADVITKTIDERQYEMYGYNGMIPGPTIRAEQGSEITVEFTNNLPEPTTVHWHGLRHDNKDDGVPGVTQEEVLPGASFTYTLRFPDEGVYWYHPHVREDRQQDLGLYGNIIVAPTEDVYNPVAREELVVLDDILLEGNEIVPYGKDEANFALMGRFGNTILANGKTAYSLDVAPGSTVRFFITNVANARPFNVSIPGARLTLVGSDIGRYERETLVDNVVIAPAERHIIEATFPEAGSYALMHITPHDSVVLGTITAAGDPVEPTALEPHAYPDVEEDIARFAEHFDREPDEEFRLTVAMHGAMMEMMEHEQNAHDAPAMMMEGMPCHQMPDGSWVGDCGNADSHASMMGTVEPIEWEDDMGPMNRMGTSETVTWIIEDLRTGERNMDIPMRYARGDIVKIRLFNDPESMHPMQHPIHLHGQRFLITHIDGESVENKVWKDTVLVPAGGTIDILVDVTNPGEWMLHCHIAEHLTAGMMASVVVE